jgi:superfamily II DNA or RNA helicase
LTAIERESLRKLVGDATFERGSAYARHGAVIEWSSELDGSLSGAIVGSRQQPYRAFVTFSPSASRTGRQFEGTCTCPVGLNCKHAVALLLVAHASQNVAPPRGDVSRSWQEEVGSLLDPLRRSTVDRDLEVALQFDTSTHGSTRLRPVVAGRNGWIRSGISWPLIERSHTIWVGRSQLPTEKAGILRELVTLAHSTRTSTYYGYGDDPIYLEKITSRRIWDLLAEAVETGIPLVGTGKPVATVDLSRTPAEVVLDARRSSSGLEFTLRLHAEGAALSAQVVRLIGSPGHGVIWTTKDEVAPIVHLAPLHDPVDERTWSRVDGPSISIPPGDEATFFAGPYSELCELFPVISSDESVELPPAAERVLRLLVEHHDGHRMGLSWFYGFRGGSVGVPIGGGDGVPPTRSVGEAIVAAARVAATVPGLVRQGRSGPVLCDSQVSGMRVVDVVTRVLPGLARIEALEIVERGTPAAFAETSEAPVVTLGGTASETGDWFDLNVEITVAGEAVPFAELFAALAEERSHCILPSGTYFSLDVPELHRLAALIREARQLPDGPDGGIRLTRVQAGLWEELAEGASLDEQAAAWHRSVAVLLGSHRPVDQAVPASLSADLRPYQEEGFRWLAHLYEFGLGGILADDMGLGKTLQALALVCHVHERQRDKRPFLVIAPTSVVGNWASECARFAPEIAVTTVSETKRRRHDSIADLAAKAGVLVTSYTLFRLEAEEYDDVEWAGVFIDEAQFVKNRASQAYKGVRAMSVPFKVAMTGTPLENNLMELWALTSIVAPGLFPRADAFAEHFQRPIERGEDPERLTQLRRRLRPLMLRRTKEAVAADLPEKQEQVLELQLDPKHRRLYETYLHRERQRILGLLGDFKKNRIAIFRSLTLLRQAALDIALVEPSRRDVPSAKLDALMGMIEDIAVDGHRVLVFSQFTRFLAIARKRLDRAGLGYCYLDGRTRNRAAVIDEFRSGTDPVFFISLKAGGFGLNLTEADYVVLLDPWWNPATEAQAVDRVHRIGQQRTVMVYRLVAKETIEEKVMALKVRKAALFASVIDNGSFESAALSEEDVRALLD